MNCKEHGLAMRDCKVCLTKLTAQYEQSGTLGTPGNVYVETKKLPGSGTIMSEEKTSEMIWVEQPGVARFIKDPWPSNDLVAQLATMIYTSPDGLENVQESVALARKICQEVDK